MILAIISSLLRVPHDVLHRPAIIQFVLGRDERGSVMGELAEVHLVALVEAAVVPVLQTEDDSR